MKLTEDEACNKMCCQSLTHLEHTTSVMHCCASACMHWRWFDTWGDRRGYCGLSGRPQED